MIKGTKGDYSMTFIMSAIIIVVVLIAVIVWLAKNGDLCKFAGGFVC